MSLDKRNLNIDLLKVMSCIAVVGLHTLYFSFNNLNRVIYYLCGFAVPVFFMCSGYFMLKKTGGYSFKRLKNKILNICRLTLLWNIIFF